MVTRNNKGEVVGEINTLLTPDGGLIVTNTLYDPTQAGRVVVQHVSSKDRQGNVKNQNVLGGKILP